MKINPLQLTLEEVLSFSKAAQRSNDADHDLFDGPAYDPKLDDKRLTGQLKRVFDLMADGQWRTLRQIADQTGDPEASVSAQLRHLRKPRFGAHQVERRHVEGGLFEYQLIPSSNGILKTR